MRNFLLSLGAAALAGAISTAPLQAQTAHCYSMGSKSQQFGFAQFPVNNLDGFKIDKSVSSGQPQVMAGEYVDGRYYTFTGYYDTLFGQGVESDEYVVWSPANNFSRLSSVSTSGTARVIDMAFDYTTNIMFALAETAVNASSIGETALYAVDLSTGAITLVGLPGDIKAQNGYGNWVDEHLMALACDMNGQLFALGEYRQLYKLDKFTGLATAQGTRQKIAVSNDFQTMAFTPEGKLYLAQCHPDYEYFMEIDPETGALTNPVTGEAVSVNADYTNNAARFPNDPQISALYFEGKTLFSAAPEAVANLKAARREGTANTIDISWTLPATNRDGSAAAITEVRVYRFGTTAPIATLPADATAYTDLTAPNGELTYLVEAVCAEHAGFPAWTSVFSGADMLKAVGNLKAELDGDKATVSWTAPTETVNGGYADYDNITYIVKEVIGTEKRILASSLSALTLTTELTQNGTYSFEVIPVTAGIEGTPALSNEVTLSSVAQIPYNTGFEDNDGGTLWTFRNTASGSYGWSIITGYAYQQLSGKFAQFKTGGSATIPADDWMISPAIHFPAGSYELEFWANGGSFDTHTYKVWLGSNPENLTQELYSLTDEKVYGDDAETKNYIPVTVKFSVDSDGDYHIGFQGIGAATYSTLKIDNLSVKADAEVGAENVGADDSEEGVRYFNLQGIEVKNPSAGIYIEKTGGKTRKIRIR